jgi:Domain of unknown function (DUF5134)
MAIAMAGMLVASLQTLPNSAWDVIFAAMTAWFGYRVIRDAQVSGARALAGGHCAPHLVHAAAMLYMFVAFAAPAAHASGGMGMTGGMSGMGTLQVSFVAFVFALILIGYSIWDLDQLSGGIGAVAGARTAPTGPALAQATAGPGEAAVFASSSGPEGSTVSASSSGRVGSAVATAVRRGHADALTSRADQGVLAPWVATSCRIAMGVTMAFMLLIMI